MTEALPKSEHPQGGGAMFFLCGLLIGVATVGFVLAARMERQATPDEIAILAEVPPSVKSLHRRTYPDCTTFFDWATTSIRAVHPTTKSRSPRWPGWV